MPDPSSQSGAGKRRALLNRLSTRFSTFNKPLPTSPTDDFEEETPSGTMKPGQGSRDPVELSSFLSLPKDPSSSSFFPSRSSWTAPSVPLIFPKPKPPPLILQSSNLGFSSLNPPSQPSVRPPLSPSRHSPLLSPPSPLFTMPQRPPSMLLSASSASSSPGSPPNSATSRWVRNRPKVGPPLTPPPNYPIPSLPPSHSDVSQEGPSQDDGPWQFREHSSRRDSFLNLAESPTDHDEDGPKLEGKDKAWAAEANVPHLARKGGTSCDPACPGNQSRVSVKLTDWLSTATDDGAGPKVPELSTTSASSEEYLTPPEHRPSPDASVSIYVLAFTISRLTPLVCNCC